MSTFRVILQSLFQQQRRAMHAVASAALPARLVGLRWAAVLLLCLPVLFASLIPSGPVLAQQVKSRLYCFGTGGSNNPTIEGLGNPPVRCYRTRNEFYDAVVETINSKGEQRTPSYYCDYDCQMANPVCNSGPCSGNTFYTRYYNYFKQPIPGDPLATCAEPARGAVLQVGLAGPAGACGINYYSETIFSDGTVFGPTIGTPAAYRSLATLSCDPDAAIYIDPNDPTKFKCVDVRITIPQPPCNECPKGGSTIYPLTGAEVQTVSLGVTLGGMPLTFTYDTKRQKLATAQGGVTSQLQAPPGFGPLWASSYHLRLDVKNGASSVDVHRGDGRVISFNLSAGQYAAQGAVSDKLTAVSGGYLYQDFRAGTLESYNSAGSLTALAHKSGATLAFTYSGGYLTAVTDNTGRAVQFTYAVGPGGDPLYDAQVTSIRAPDGTVIGITYDQSRNLTGITWPDGRSKAYRYEHPVFGWAKTAELDENGVAVDTLTYDAYGNATSSVGALGSNSLSVSYGTPPTLGYVETFVPGGGVIYTDAIVRNFVWAAPTGVSMTYTNGTVASLSTALTGNYPTFTSISQPAGSGNAAADSSRTYDDRGNVTSRDDFQGQRICYTYDGGNRELVRVEGLTTATACSSVTPATATLPAGARKYTTAWETSWGTPITKTEPGRATTLVYQGQPDPQNSNALANCSPAAALANGAPLNLLCKSIVQLASGAYFDNPAAASTDPDIGKVVLLLHGEDGAGSPVFADSSAYLKSPSTRARSPVVTTAQYKFGASSINLDSMTGPSSGVYGAFGYGPDDTLKLTGDFTIEMFVKLNVQSDPSRFIFGWGGDPNNGGATVGHVSVDSSGKLMASWWEHYCCAAPSITGPVISAGVWHHIALSRYSGNWIMHLDGVQAGSVVYHNNSDSFASGRFELGRHTPAMGFGNLNGYLDEVRITKGKVRYWANFTPPTQAFGDPLNLDPSMPKQIDPYYAQDTLLLHADGVHGSKSIVDRSPLARTGTLKRNAQISTTDSKFGGSSFYVPGSTDAGDYGSLVGDYSLPGDFTVEFWMKPSSTTAAAYSLQIWGSATYDTFYTGSDRLVLQSSDGSYCMFGAALAGLANTWIHVAFVRISGTITAYVNGNPNGSCSRSTTVGGTGAVLLGFNNTSNAVYYDDIRITRGRGRYTAAFVPSPYAAPNVATLPPNASIDTTQYTYDAAGRVLTVKDTLNRTTGYTYYADTQFTGTAPAEIGHTAGDLQSITNAAGHVTQFTQYDRAGRVRQMIDPKGLVTDISYTPRGWVSTVSTTAPAGTPRVTSYSYDNVGQVTGVTQPDGSALSYSYDAAHRLVGVTDAKGNSVSYTLDSVGNRVAEDIKDPSGALQRSISRSFDALNRLQQVTGAAQ